MSLAWVVPLAALLHAPQLEVAEAARVDVPTLERGITLRIGDAADPWDVVVEGDADGVRVQARAPGRALVDQRVELPEASLEERATVLAASIAFALEQAPEVSVAVAEPSPVVPPPSPRPWWLGLEGAVSVGVPLDPSGGLSLGAGRWLGRRASVRVGFAAAWVLARRAGLSVDAVVPSLHVGVGHRWDRVWVGAVPHVGVASAWARDRTRAHGWALWMRVPAAVEVEVAERWSVRGFLGVDVHTPSLRFVGADSVLRWRVVRPVAGIGTAVRLP